MLQYSHKAQNATVTKQSFTNTINTKVNQRKGNNKEYNKANQHKGNNKEYFLSLVQEDESTNQIGLGQSDKSVGGQKSYPASWWNWVVPANRSDRGASSIFGNSSFAPSGPLISAKIFDI